MPAHPRPSGARALALLAAGLLVAACASACDTAAVHHLRGRATVVDSLAVTLDRFQYSAFRADYRLGDGEAGTVAHAAAPQRSEYLFTTGRYVTAFPTGSQPTAPVTVTACAGPDGASRCTLTDADPNVHAQPDLAAIRHASANRFIAVQEALSLVMAAAQDDHSTLTTRFTTIAGQRAHCVTVASDGTTRFDTCITTRGALASFQGRADGHRIDVMLTGYQRAATGVSFAAPAGARITDRRARA